VTGVSRLRGALIHGIGVFVVLSIFRLIWP